MLCFRCLRSRSFQTAEFHRQHEAVITPVGLCWYNTDWDTSLNKYYQQTLGMKEPIYEYEFPKPYLAPMVHYPSRRNFVHYMDIHRDSKETSETMLLQRLKQLDPFKTETPRLPYPHAHPISYMLPTWRSQEIKKERLGIGKYRELYRNEYDITAETDQELQDASQFEVERGHAARLGLDWQTVYQGKKKTKTLKEKEEALKIEESEKQAQSA
uniref:39S ribosomal protein L38 n=1 Tax=Hirondellea gigas TaxID=1518452 RepID=A0A6A7FPM4_9CRUS